jgi:hypothetical protein
MLTYKIKSCYNVGSNDRHGLKRATSAFNRPEYDKLKAIISTLYINDACHCRILHAIYLAVYSDCARRCDSFVPR